MLTSASAKAARVQTDDRVSLTGVMSAERWDRFSGGDKHRSECRSADAAVRSDTEGGTAKPSTTAIRHGSSVLDGVRRSVRRQLAGS